MIEYWDIDKFINKKADLYNYINPFFDLNYMKSHNFFYINISLFRYKNYFDNLYNSIDANIRLDINQRIAILTNSKNELIIAGAGSGKTTTIAAKIKFMTDILKIDPNSILLLSYTNEAVLEMKKIVVEKFKINIQILTFHKFAILLIGKVKNIKDTIDYEEISNNFTIKEKYLLLMYFLIFYNLNLSDIKKKNLKFILIFSKFHKDCMQYYYEGKHIKKNLKTLLFKKLCSIYFKKLKKEIFTFDSIIYNAYQLKNYKYHYKYILIDEYQDISNLRFKFIKKYADLENSKLMCVGDDWQTIYSFASSDIDNILNFEKIFTDTKVLKIVNTYRNSQELINIAGEFIMKNHIQIKKKLKSKKHLENPIKILKYKNNNEKIKLIAETIEKLIDKKIAILLRYKNELFSIIDNKNFKLCDNKLIFKDKKEIYFFTIHTSKGLGFDYVFLINLDKGYFGFPSKRKENSLFCNENTIFEERRLYYVALTRTKNIVYLVSPAKHYSIFLKETKKMLKKK